MSNTSEILSDVRKNNVSIHHPSKTLRTRIVMKMIAVVCLEMSIYCMLALKMNVTGGILCLLSYNFNANMHEEIIIPPSQNKKTISSNNRLKINMSVRCNDTNVFTF